MIFIGIAGGTGSGKTTLAETLKEKFNGSVSIIAYDNYYRDQGNLTPEEKERLNYDCPEILDTPLLIEQLKALRDGKTIQMPVYNFKTHSREKEITIPVAPNDIIIVEGILLFHTPELRDLLDLKIFIDVSDDIRILRRVKRDIEERGRTINSVTRQYIATVKPMHEKYVAPSKKYADIILNDSMNTNAVDLISNRMMHEIQHK